MKRQFLVLACLFMTLGAMADDVQTVTVGGVKVDKTVKRITFNGDDVILHFTDNTTDTENMGVEMKIAFDLTNSIGKLEFDVVNDSKVFNLRGQYMGDSLDGLRAGVYIQNGKKVIVK